LGIQQHEPCGWKTRRRQPAQTESKQLTKDKDAETILNYSNPAYVLGWKPAMAPLILAHPAAATVATGQEAMFTVKAAGIPDATYQWLRNGAAIRGATDSTLKLSKVKQSDAGRYSVTVTNASGRVTSDAAVLTVR
jgi:membrane carboxypeptidase/penicillin-binding protein PbpC